MRLSIAFLYCFCSFFGFSQVAPDVVLTTGHNDQVNAMDVTDNGVYLASASNDKIIKIWDLATGREFRTISGTAGRVEQLDFSPDQIHLAATTSSNELIVWNVISGEVDYSGFAGTGKGLAYVNNGNTILFINESSQVSALDISTRSTSVVSEDYTISFVVNDKNKTIYALDHLGNLNKTSFSTGEKQTYKLFDEFNFPFSNSDITTDGRFIAFGFNDDRLRIFDTQKGAFSYESTTLSSKIITLAFDRSKPVIYYTLHTGEVILFNYLKEKKIEERKFHEDGFRVQSIAAYPKGNIMLFANNERITLFDFKRKNVFKVLDRKVNRIFNMAYDPKGRYLAIATDKINIKVWDLKLNKLVRTINGFFPCQFTPDGSSIIAMTPQIKLGVFDVENGKSIKTFDTNSELIQTIAITDDGEKIAGAGFQNTIKVWNFKDKKRIATLEGHTGGIVSLDFHPNEPLIVSGSYDQTARVWNYEQKKEIKQFTDQTIIVKAVKFSPDGSQFATASWDKTIYLRSTENWQTEHILRGHINNINTIDYSKDGLVLVSGAGNSAVGNSDNSIYCWDTKTGEQKCQFNEHQGEILKVICDPMTERFFFGLC